MINEQWQYNLFLRFSLLSILTLSHGGVGWSQLRSLRKADLPIFIARFCRIFQRRQKQKKNKSKKAADLNC